MSRSTKRVLTGACAVLLCAGALAAAAAPAHAETTTTAIPASKLVTITQNVGALGSPRENTATTTEVRTGEIVEALCGFSHAGRDWVKIQAHGLFGFVPTSTVQGGSIGLPRECPSEVTSITIPTPSLSFSSVAWGVPLEGYTCPWNYPFLDARTDSGAAFFDTGKTHIPGLRIDRTDGIGIYIGALVTATDPKGSGEYVAGYTGVAVTNHLPVAKATFSVTCTNNPALAMPA